MDDEDVLVSDWTWTDTNGEPLTVVPEDGWFCQMCEYTAETELQVHGHIAGKHRKKMKPVRHGTTAGYRAEKNRGLPTCPACRVAWRRFYRAYRAHMRRT